MIPLQGFAPDIEAPTPGVLTDCSQFIPYETGMEAAPSPLAPLGVGPLASSCEGSGVVTKLDGSRRIFAGTQTRLWELVGTTWIDRSPSAFTGGPDSRWDFTQFGDSTIATNRANDMQISNSGAFAPISGAPRAEIVFSVGSFVMALNVNDGAEKPDGWHCSAVFDATDWTESVTTQSNSGRLVTTPGPITAGLRLGEYAVAYKYNSMYLGQYVGSPVVWDWTLVPSGEAGCVGKNAVCAIDGMHFFVGSDNFWLFDGTRPVPVGDMQVRQWFADNANPKFLYKTQCLFDYQQNRIWVFYPANGSTVCNAALVYHLRSKKWGRADRVIQSVVNYVEAGVTIDTMDLISPTMDGFPPISFDSQFWLEGGKTVAVFDGSNQLQSLVGPAGTSSFSLGEVGDDSAVTLMQGMAIRFSPGRRPTTASLATFHKMTSGDVLQLGHVATLNDGKFDVLKAARWHSGTVTMTGDVRVVGVMPRFVPVGTR